MVHSVFVYKCSSHSCQQAVLAGLHNIILSMRSHINNILLVQCVNLCHYCVMVRNRAFGFSMNLVHVVDILVGLTCDFSVQNKHW